MRKFYVNECFNHELASTFEPGPGEHIIGLFKQCQVICKSDSPHLSLFHSYYLNTELYAFYIANDTERISNIVVLEMPIKYHEIKIPTNTWTCVVEAETVEEAIRSFGEKKWRRFELQKDEWRPT